jgi:predicted nucleic acid-binding protein
VVVYASIWVSRLFPQDELHERCQKWLLHQRAAGVTLVSPSLLIPEVSGAISRRAGDLALSGRAVQMLQSLPGLRRIEMNQVVIQGAAQLAAICGMRGAESVYTAVVHQLNIPLASLDTDKRAKAGRMVAIQKDFP